MKGVALRPLRLSISATMGDGGCAFDFSRSLFDGLAITSVASFVPLTVFSTNPSFSCRLIITKACEGRPGRMQVHCIKIAHLSLDGEKLG